MSSRSSVDAVLNRVRPFLRADGGDLELVEVHGNTVGLRLSGACADCPQAELTLHFGIEAALREVMPNVQVVRHDRS